MVHDRDARQDPGAHLGAQRKRLGAGDLAVGPARHLVEERERLDGLTWEHFSVRRLAPTLGAEIHGVDLTADLDDAVIRDLRQALWGYKVIFFRGQPLTADQHVAFAARFGELEIHPVFPGHPGRPELVRFEKTAEVAGYENLWHHDVTWREAPSMGAVLHAIEVPPVGGDTLFADMHAAWAGLDEETKERLEGLVAEHDFMKAFGMQVPPAKYDEVRAQYPVVRHPVVITHEATGRKLLYVNLVFTTRILGLDDADSSALLRSLCDQAATPEYQVRFTWTNDAVAFWDNRAVQHYAASDYWPQRRVMERASIVGTRPVA